MQENTSEHKGSVLEKPKPSKRRAIKRLKAFIIAILWLIVLGPFIGIYTMLNISDDGTLPGFEELENPQSSLASTVLSVDGVELGKYYKENRTNAKYNNLSHWLVEALVATEDSRYYEHSGVDARAISRAIYGQLTGDDGGGASTISQQLAKLLFTKVAKGKMERLWQKFGENIVAVRLEKNYTKEEIITF